MHEGGVHGQEQSDEEEEVPEARAADAQEARLQARVRGGTHDVDVIDPIEMHLAAAGAGCHARAGEGTWAEGPGGVAHVDKLGDNRVVPGGGRDGDGPGAERVGGGAGRRPGLRRVHHERRGHGCMRGWCVSKYAKKKGRVDYKG